jgi:DNA-binding response OmpR family regulator
MHVLVVEDEPALRAFLLPLLVRHGFSANAVATGAAGVAAVLDRRPDLVLLDLNLPDMDGLEVCRRLRRQDGRHLPIVMLTGRDTREDELAGFAAAADDYVVKPFDPDTLVARIRATLRLAGVRQARRHRLGDVTVDLDLRRAERDGVDLGLARKEFDLLAFLLEHPNRVFGKAQLLDQVWGPEFTGDTHTVEVRYGTLRRLIEANPNRPRFLLTRPGVGYYLLLPDARRADPAEALS